MTVSGMSDGSRLHRHVERAVELALDDVLAEACCASVEELEDVRLDVDAGCVKSWLIAHHSVVSEAVEADAAVVVAALSSGRGFGVDLVDREHPVEGTLSRLLRISREIMATSRLRIRIAGSVCSGQLGPSKPWVAGSNPAGGVRREDENSGKALQSSANRGRTRRSLLAASHTLSQALRALMATRWLLGGRSR